MRENISFDVSEADRKRLLAIAADRNTPAKVVWRAKIILATADGLGTMAIMRETGKSKPCVWRWQERFIYEGVDWLLRDRMRPPGMPPLPESGRQKVLAKTASGEAAERDTVERADNGEGHGHQPDERAAHLERGRTEAASC